MNRFQNGRHDKLSLSGTHTRLDGQQINEINVKSALCSTTVVVVSTIHLAAAVAVEVVAVADGGRRRTNVISVVSIFFSFALNVCACRPGAHVYCKKTRGRPIHNSLYISR